MHALNDWKVNLYALIIVDIRIETFTTHPHSYKHPPSRLVKPMKRQMEKLHSTSISVIPRKSEFSENCLSPRPQPNIEKNVI